MIKRIIFQCILASLLVSGPGHAAIGDWKTITSSKDVRHLAVADTLIWCATNGGVLKYNWKTQIFTNYTNTEGLSGNDFTAIAVDKKNRVWAAAADGKLNVFDPQAGTWKTVLDYEGYSIKNILTYGDSVFLALNIGVSLYDGKRWEVKETYKIGEARQIIISNRQIWAACKEGVLSASLDFPNLMAPSAWMSYNVFPGVASSDVATVLFDGSLVYAGTRKGLAVFDGSAWQASGLAGTEIRDLQLWRGEVNAVTAEGIFRRSGDASWQKMAGSPVIGVHSGSGQDGALWVGLADAGLAQLTELNGSWRIYTAAGPPGNKFSSLAIDRSGNLWTASSSSGISRFDGVNWQHFTKNNGKLNENDYRDLTVDAKNRVWAASWGGGVSVFETEGDSVKISFITSSDNRLSGILSDAKYVVTTRVFADAAGNVWICNYMAGNSRVLAVVDENDNWQYFTTLEGIKSQYLTALAVDKLGRKWIGTEDAGINVLDDNGTPFDKSDDDLTQGLNRADGLDNLNIKSLAFDLDGVMWIATPEGLNYWFDGKVKPRTSLINDNINVVAVDVRNNKWIGTVGGISRLDADGFSLQHFYTSNSPLVSDYITCFAFDENTGDTYIGTTNGLSLLSTPYTKPASDLSLVSGYPNPFVLRDGHAMFYIDQLAEKSTVRIYTPDGFLIKNIPQEKILGSRVAWDGTNDQGDQVSSGVYVYLITTESGLSKLGKVAVLKP